MPAAFLSGSANIVAIAFVTAFGRMVGRHGTVAASATNQSLEQSAELVSDHDATGSTVVLLDRLETGGGRPELTQSRFCL